MAQADSVRSSSRQLITGESANQSTSLCGGYQESPALLHRRLGRPRHYKYQRGSAPLALAEKNIELEDLSNCRWYATSTGQEPLGSNIGALSFETVGFLLGRLLRNIVVLLRSGAGISACD